MPGSSGERELSIHPSVRVPVWKIAQKFKHAKRDEGNIQKEQNRFRGQNRFQNQFISAERSVRTQAYRNLVSRYVLRIQNQTGKRPLEIVLDSGQRLI